MKRYFKIWLFLTSISSQVALMSRFGAGVFFIGKFLRFGLFLFFILLIQSKTKTIAGYNLWEIIFFYATFNLIDVCAQFFLREVYAFRNNVVSGRFDNYLTKPLSPLFRSLFGGTDILDLPMLVVSIGLAIFSGMHIDSVTLTSVLLYILLLINAFVIALSFHIFVVSIGILTTEVDNTLWIYRDLTQMGRLPIDIYREPISFLLTFVFPIAIMITYPAKALMGTLGMQLILFSFMFGIGLLCSSVALWRYALRYYSSASS